MEVSLIGELERTGKGPSIYQKLMHFLTLHPNMAVEMDEQTAARRSTLRVGPLAMNQRFLSQRC